VTALPFVTARPSWRSRLRDGSAAGCEAGLCPAVDL